MPVRSRDEAGNLAAAFNHMLDAIASRVQALIATKEELRQALASLKRSESEQQRLTQQAQTEHARLQALLSAMELGILLVGSDGRVVYHNPAFRRIWMIDERALIAGEPATAVLSRSTSQLSRPDHFSCHILGAGHPRGLRQLEIPIADGRVVTQINHPVRDAKGQFIGHLWIYEDVTKERQTAAQLAYLAERDLLTGLYNRHHFQLELTHAGRMRTQCKPRRAAVLRLGRIQGHQRQH